MLEKILRHIIKEPALHARWLNTLSYLENCGARKISRCEHPTKVGEEMLKHAAEEFRHAHFFKKQMRKLPGPFLKDYSFPSLVGGFATVHYLARLDLNIARKITSKEKTIACYLLTTYAIEKRARCVYPLYNTLLKELEETISVKSILLEEEEHLSEIEAEMEFFPDVKMLAPTACQIEEILFQEWLVYLDEELSFVCSGRSRG